HLTPLPTCAPSQARPGQRQPARERPASGFRPPDPPTPTPPPPRPAPGPGPPAPERPASGLPPPDRLKPTATRPDHASSTPHNLFKPACKHPTRQELRRRWIQAKRLGLLGEPEVIAPSAHVLLSPTCSC